MSKSVGPSKESIEGWLRRMDVLRYEDGDRALAELRARTHEIPLRLTPLYLGVCGSTYRITGAQQGKAAECLEWGLYAAKKLGDRWGTANLLRRKAFLELDRGECGIALELAERAGGIFLSLGDQIWMGKTLVDQGIFLGYLGKNDEAVRSCLKGLPLLPESECQSRCALFHALARLYKSLGRKKEALDNLRKAIPLSRKIGEWLQGKIVWLYGELCLESGFNSEAESHLKDAIAIYRLRSPLATALITIDLLRALLRQAKTEEAEELVKSTIPLLNQLHSNRLAASALVELHRTRPAAISLNVLREIKQQLVKARERDVPAPRRCD